MFDSWFGFVYEIAFLISDVFYKYFISNWNVIIILASIFVIVAFMSIIVRGLTIGSSMASEGYTDFMNKMFASDIATKFFVGATLFAVTIIPINVTVHYPPNKLIPTKIINIVFENFNAETAQDTAISQSQPGELINSSKDTFNATEVSELKHHLPLIVAVPIFLFDTILFGTDGTNGLLPAIFGNLYSQYADDPQAIPKKYLQFYFNKNIFDEIQNRLLNGALDMNIWYTKVIPDTLTVFGFGGDNEKVKIYEGEAGAILTIKAGVQKLLYLMLKGYDEGFDKFDAVIAGDKSLDTKALANLDSDDTLRKIMKNEFTKKKLSEGERDRLGRERGIKSATSATEYKSINTKQTLLTEINKNEGGAKNKNGKTMSSALAIVEYPMVLMSGISARYATMDLTYDKSKGFFSGFWGNLVDLGDTSNYIKQGINEGADQLKKYVTSDFFATANVENVKCLVEQFSDDATLECIDKQLVDSCSDGDCYSIFHYINLYRWDRDNSDNWIKQDTEDVINTYYSLLDSFLMKGTVDKSAFNIYPVAGKKLVDGLIKKYENNKLYDKLATRRQIILDGLEALRITNISDEEDFTKEIAQLEALLKLYETFMQQVGTIMLKYKDYTVNSYGAMQEFLHSNTDFDATKRDQYDRQLKSIPDEVESATNNTMQYEKIVPELFNWLSSDEGGGLMSMLKKGSLSIARGLMLFFTLLFLVMSMFMFIQFFLMRSIHGFVFLVLWPVHVFKVILTSDITKFKVIFKDWLTFRGYDLVLIIALVLTNMFIECAKVFYLDGMKTITDANVQSIYGNVIIALFSFITYQTLRLLYQQFCKIIEQSDSVFAQSIGRISDSMTASAGVFSSVSMGALALSKQLGGTLATGAATITRVFGKDKSGASTDGVDILNKLNSGKKE